MRYLSGKKVSTEVRLKIINYWLFVKSYAGKRRDITKHHPYCVGDNCRDICPYKLNDLDNRLAYQIPLGIRDILEICELFPKLSKNYHSLTSIIEIVKMMPHAIRPLKTFTAKSKSEKALFSELIRHLFCKYKIPKWIESQFRASSLDKTNEFIVLVQDGKNADNLYKLSGLYLSHKASHYAYNAPDDTISFRAAIVYGLARAAKCNEYLAVKLSTTRLYELLSRKTRYEWCLAWLQWLGCQPMFDSDRVGEMVDFIIQSDINMKGRTMASFMRLVDVWHDEQAAIAKTYGGILPSSKIPNWEYTEKKKDEDLDAYTYVDWKIVNITTGKELRAEGKELKHCVGSFFSSIENRRCDIFSLRMNKKIIATIELRLPENVIVQIRGNCNSVVTGKPKLMIEKWARKYGIGIRST